MATYVVTTKAIDRYPFHGIPAGERGLIIDVDEETGSLLIEMERYFASLRPWRNCLHIPPQCRSEIRET
jgi:hypothetical protein